VIAHVEHAMPVYAHAPQVQRCTFSSRPPLRALIPSVMI
jgi:hypothetical protein